MARRPALGVAQGDAALWHGVAEGCGDERNCKVIGAFARGGAARPVVAGADLLKEGLDGLGVVDVLGIEEVQGEGVCRRPVRLAFDHCEIAVLRAAAATLAVVDKMRQCRLCHEEVHDTCDTCEASGVCRLSIVTRRVRRCRLQSSVPLTVNMIETDSHQWTWMW